MRARTFIGLSLLVLIAGAAALVWSRRSVPGPPELRLGKDECAECGMTIEEDRFSCALIIREDGQETYLAFDDIGDMLDYERSHADMDVRRRYVHDCRNGYWLRAETATYTFSEATKTPMGSGLAAYPDADSARAAPKDARVIPYSELATFRVEWKKSRARGR